MVLERKDEVVYIYACGECFAICEEEDNFCWGCGAEFEGEAYGREDFRRKEG